MGVSADLCLILKCIVIILQEKRQDDSENQKPEECYDIISENVFRVFSELFSMKESVPLAGSAMIFFKTKEPW